MGELWGDVRYGWRLLLKSPGFALGAILTLALCLGANTAIFSLVDTVLLHPLPYAQPGQIMLITESLPREGPGEVGVSIQEARDFAERNSVFSETATFESEAFNLTGQTRPLRINAARVSASAFPLLGVRPVIGRAFTGQEDRFGAANVAVISSLLWRKSYGGSRSIVGTVIRLDEKSYTVVGVMPPAFRFPFDGAPLSEMPDVWVPEDVAPARLAPEARVREFGVGLIGRLRPGVPAARARADVVRIAREFEKEHPESYGGNVHVEPHLYSFAAYSVKKARPLVILLMCAVACVLLIACVNVGNLLLARSSRRSGEMAVRTAIGAPRLRLIRQCLVESLLISLLSAALGLLFASAILQALRVWGPQGVPRLHDVQLHPLTFWFTLGLAVLTSLLFGLAPAWRLSRTSTQESLRSASPVGANRSTHRFQSAVVVAEVALAVVLLIAGGLLIRSFLRLLETPFGFDPRNAFVVRTLLTRARYPDPARRIAVQEQLLHRLAELPGIQKVAAASHLPLSDQRGIGFHLENAPRGDSHWAENSLVSPGYFQAMGIALLKGRDFDWHDRANTPPVAIVSQAFVRQNLAGRNPIGQRFQWSTLMFTIVGVAADVHIGALDADPPPMIYNSMFQVESGAAGRTALVIRGATDLTSVTNSVERILASLDPDLPLYDITSFEALIDESLAQRRFIASALSAFALAAVLLAGIGLFGLLSYVAGDRRREIGVRMALGATRESILAMFLRKGFVLGCMGSLCGLALSGLSARLLRASLYRVSAFDPFTLAAVPALFVLIALAAVYLPARRAASTDPLQALRTE